MARERDPSLAHRLRAERLLENAALPARSDEAWEAQVQSILAKARSAAVDAALLDPPLPQASGEPDELEIPKHPLPETPRGRQQVERRLERPGPSFTWLLAGVVGLAAAALLVIRVRRPALDVPARQPAAVASAKATAPQQAALAAPTPAAGGPAEEPAPELAAAAEPRLKPAERVAQRPAGVPGKRAVAKPPAQPAIAGEQILEPNPALTPADGRQPLNDRPSAGEVNAALASVLGPARACLAAGSSPASVELVFGSEGRVQAVNIGGKTAPEGAAACLRSALGKARVAPFARPSWRVPYTVRAP